MRNTAGRNASSRPYAIGSPHANVAEPNLVLRGWAAYFRDGTSSRKFTMTDSYVQERLAIFDSAKHGRTGRNWLSHNKAWLERLGIYRLSKATQTLKAHA
jgi:RNA-directed DNA polymerase